MKTENFSLPTASAVQIFHTRVRVIRYDEGSGTGTPLIRVRSLNTGELDVEMKPGRQIIMPQAVDGIIITNLTANPITGKVTIGAGDVSDNSLVGTVTLDAAALAALEAIDLNTASLASLKTPYASTGNHKANSAMVANTAEQVFSAAANTAGAIILTADFFAVNASAWVQASLLAKASAPANIIDGEIIWSPQQLAYSSGGYAASGAMPREAYLPAGVGLYFISSVATTTQHRACRYRLL